MNNPDSTSQSQGNSSSKSIELLVEVTMEELQRGVRVNYDEINRRHPELQPELESRLLALKNVFELGQQERHNDE